MSTKVPPIPPDMHTLTPHLIVYDPKAAIEFYKRAFGATELACLTTPDGKVMHASMKIGDSHIMLAGECRDYGGFAPTALGNSPVTIHMYVEDADAAFERAVFAGASIVMPVQEMFWGDRYGKLVDPFGHHWSIATCVKQVSPEEMAKAAECAFAQ